MGQMTMAVMLAVDAGEACFEDWRSLLDEYESGLKPDYPHGDTDKPDLIGFWVAVGASGHSECPDLESFPLDEFLRVPKHKKAFVQAVRAWEKFESWALARGHEFGEPRLWLVQTEVAGRDQTARDTARVGEPETPGQRQ